MKRLYSLKLIRLLFLCNHLKKKQKRKKKQSIAYCKRIILINICALFSVLLFILMYNINFNGTNLVISHTLFKCNYDFEVKCGIRIQLYTLRLNAI